MRFTGKVSHTSFLDGARIRKLLDDVLPSDGCMYPSEEKFVFDFEPIYHLPTFGDVR
jgi:hypothetical protein